VYNRLFPIALLVALGAAAPAIATAAAPAAAQSTPAPAQNAPATRAGLLKGMDVNFKAIDSNGDGTLSAAELQAAEVKVQQRRIATLRGRVEAEFTKLDTNKDGQLSKAEFMAAAPATASTPANGGALLTQLDKNKDGKVSVDEYRAPVLARFDTLDTNHDGTLSDAEKKAAEARTKR
jgi:Ca2+-binding EF-hand superfamily protein